MVQWAYLVVRKNASRQVPEDVQLDKKSKSDQHFHISWRSYLTRVDSPLLLGMKKEDTDFLILYELIDDISTLFPTLIERDEQYPIPL